MNHAALRRALVGMLTGAVAPVRVTDGEPDTVTDVTVVARITESLRQPDLWRHEVEVAIVIPPAGTAAATQQISDDLACTVAMAVDAWAPGPQYTATRPRVTYGETVTVGTTPTRADLCRFAITEPPELHHP